MKKIKREDYEKIKTEKDKISELKENLANLEVTKYYLMEELIELQKRFNILLASIYNEYDIKDTNFSINPNTLEIITFNNDNTTKIKRKKNIDKKKK